MNATVTSQLLSVVPLLVIVIAPLPILVHVLSDAAAQSRVHGGRADKILALLVLWIVFQSSVVAILGWSGYLRLAGMLVLEGAFFVWGLWRISRARRLNRLAWDLRGSLLTLARRPAAERSLVSIACGVGLLLTLRVLAVPVTDGDSLWFQLPRVAQWYQQATFAKPMDQLPGDIHNFYPYTWNTLFFLALAPAGHDQFALMPNVLAWVILGLATYALARHIGGRRFGAMCAALLLLLMPLSVEHVQTAHSDLPLGAFFIASVFFTMHGWRYRQLFSLLMAVICMAMMAGTKGSGFVYIAVVVALSLCLFIASRANDRQCKPWSLTGFGWMHGLAVITIGLLAGSWYIHNAVVAGNPLGVVEISILNRVLWRGDLTQAYLNQTTLLHKFSPLNAAHWEMLREAIWNSVGLPGFVLALLAIVAPVQLFSRPRVRPLLLPVLCVCLITLFLYIATPWSATWDAESQMQSWFLAYELRFSFPFWGLLAAIAGVALAPRPPAMATWGMVGLAGLGATRVATDGWTGVSTTGLAAACATAGVFLALHRASRPHPGGGWQRLIAPQKPMRMLTIGVSGMVVLIILITVVTATLLKVRTERQDVLFGGISPFIDGLPADTRIGFWSAPQPYVLYGKRLQHTLVYLPLDHYGTDDDMLRYLCTAPVDVIAVGPVSASLWVESPWVRKYVDVYSWLMKQPQHFERLHGNDIRSDVMVYRLRRTAAECRASE